MKLIVPFFSITRSMGWTIFSTRLVATRPSIEMTSATNTQM